MFLSSPPHHPKQGERTLWDLARLEGFDREETVGEVGVDGNVAEVDDYFARRDREDAGSGPALQQAIGIGARSMICD